MASSESSSDFYSKKISDSLTVGQCREKLANKYMNSFGYIQRVPWDPNDLADLKDLHTVVTMVKKDAYGKNTKTKEILQGSVDEIFSTKVNGVLPQRILISAPAGLGKTTAVAKMACDWANRVRGSSLENLPLLFAVKLRNTNRQTSIAEAIRSQLLSDVIDLTKDGLHRFIKENQSICHILLDGLDEYAGIVANEGLGSDIIDVMLWEEFPDCRVLVTTRPHLESFFNQGELPRVYTKMWIEGFSRDNSRKYIDKFFASTSNPSNGQDLKDYLDEKPLINELVNTPLFCFMVCYLWSMNVIGRHTTTQTELLDSINVCLMHHANAKQINRISGIKLRKIISKLGEVALVGLLDDAKKRIFTPHDFRKFPAILDKACELGILVTSPCLPANARENTSTTIEFYHKLAREHLAGKSLADQTNAYLLRWKISKLDRVLRQIKENIGEYENLIRFAAGTDKSLCIRIMEAILENPFLVESERYRVLLDCSSESSSTEGSVSSLIQRCVTAQSMVLKSPTVYTVVGMQNLPKQQISQIREVKFEDSGISADVTSGLWSCLGSFPTLRSLTISDSSLSFPLSPLELQSVTKLTAKRVTSQSYEGLLSSLPGLKEIHITLSDAEKDITRIMAGLRRTGRQRCPQLTKIKLRAPSSLPSGKERVSSETMRKLGLLIREQTENVQMLGLYGVKCEDEDELVDLVESCRHAGTMYHLELLDCGSVGGGRLESYTNELLNSQESFRVFLSHSDTDSEFPRNLSRLNKKGQYPETQSSSSSTDTLAQIHNDLEHSTNGDRIIRLNEYSVEVRIPLDEADGLGDVAVEALTTTPPDFVLNENEAVISVGLKVSSSKRTFKTPVKITLPHCGSFTNPEQAELVLYHRNTDSDRFVATPCTAVEIPRCVVRERDLDLYTNHFSELWITVIITKVFKGKFVLCTPHVPEVFHTNEKHLLRICIKDEKNRNQVIAYQETRFFVKWRSGDIVITCSKDNKEIYIKNIPVDKFRYRTDESPSFLLNTDDAVGCQRLIRLSLKQKFATSIEFYIYMIDNQRRDAIPAGPSNEAGTFMGDGGPVTDAILLKLSKHLLPGQFSDVHVALGIEYSIAADIRGNKTSLREQYYDLFQIWRLKSRRTVKDLKEVLDTAEAGGLKVWHF